MVAFLSLLALCKLTAKDFCILCPYATFASVPVADFGANAYTPDQLPHRYQEHLGKMLPGGGPCYHVDTPIYSKGGTREVRPIPTSFIPVQLVREFDQTPTIADALNGVSETVPDVMQTKAYKEHVVVARARKRGDAFPIPLATYLDGVATASKLAGRSDTTLGV